MDAIKATGNDLELMVLGAPYGVDRVGHEFTAATDFGDLPVVPVIHYHGWGPSDGARIGWAHKAERDSAGQWYRVTLDKASAIARTIYEDAKRGLVRASSDAISHLVRPADALKGYRGKIDRWIIGALSLMDAATHDKAINPRAIALPAVRAMLSEIANVDELELSGEATKAGAVFARRNRERIEAIRKALDEMLREFSVSEDGNEEIGAKAMNDENKSTPVITDVKDLANGVDANIAKSKQESEAFFATELGKAQAALKADFDARLAAFENTRTVAQNRPQFPTGNTTTTADAAKAIREEQYRGAFDQYVRTGNDAAVKATMVEGTAANGGYLVPIKYSNELIAPKLLASELRAAGARKISVTGTNSFKIPTLTNSSAASLIAESGAFGQNEPTLGEVTYVPYKYGFIDKVTDELVADSRMDVFREVLVPDAAYAFVQAENAAFATGTGSSQPQGIVTGASAGVTTAGATAITADEVINLFHSLGYQYRANAVWLMNDGILSYIRKLKDTTNQYLLQPGLNGGPQMTILGRPVYAVSSMQATVVTATVTMLFADPTYFAIGDWDSLEFRRLDQLYAANGQVGFQWFKRFDSHVLLSAAIKKMTQA